MRLFALIPLLLLFACDDNNNSVTMDLSAPDLAASADLRTPAATCAQTQTCIQACEAGTVATCVPACIGYLSAAAKPDFDALEACSAPACATPVDGGGVPPCANPSSQACMTCVDQACASQEATCLAH